MIENNFLDVINLLASDYEVQIDVFPNYVLIPDEIAILFVDELNVQKGKEPNWTDSQIEMLNRIYEIVCSHNEKSDFWSMNALKSHKDWSSIRELAEKFIVSIGEVPKRPKMNWMSYQQGWSD